MELTQLPAELIHGVFAQCEPAAVRSLRGVNKLSLAIANEYFLADLKLFWLVEDYRFALKLLKDRHIAKGVRTLALAADTFPEPKYVDFEAWNERRKQQQVRAQHRIQAERLLQIEPALAELRHREKHASDRGLRSIQQEKQDQENYAQAETHQASEKQVREAYDYFLSLASQASGVPTARLVLDKVDQILKSCPHINTVKLLTQGLTPIPTAACIQYRKAMVAPWRHIGSAVGGLLLTRTLGNCVGHNSPLRSFEIDTVTCSWPYPTDFKDLDSLESVRLNILSDRKVGACYAERSCIYGCQDGQLARFLNIARNLQHLVVEKSGQMPICLRGIVGGYFYPYVWPHLAKISFTNFSCFASELSDFLRRHSNTLKELKLGSALIKHTRWGDLFLSIAGTFPQLETVHLRGIFRGPTSDDSIPFSNSSGTETGLARRVQRYILEGGDGKPDFFDEEGGSGTEDEDEDEDD